MKRQKKPFTQGFFFFLLLLQGHLNNFTMHSKK